MGRMGGNLDITWRGCAAFQGLANRLILFAFCLYRALVMCILSTMYSKATLYCQEVFLILLDKI